MQIRKRSGKEWRVTALLVLLVSTNCAFCQDCQQNDVLSRIRGMVSSSSGNSIPQLITPSLSLPKSKEFYRKMLELSAKKAAHAFRQKKPMRPVHNLIVLFFFKLIQVKESVSLSSFHLHLY